MHQCLGPFLFPAMLQWTRQVIRDTGAASALDGEQWSSRRDLLERCFSHQPQDSSYTVTPTNRIFLPSFQSADRTKLEALDSLLCWLKLHCAVALSTQLHSLRCEPRLATCLAPSPWDRQAILLHSSSERNDASAMEANRVNSIKQVIIKSSMPALCLFTGLLQGVIIKDNIPVCSVPLGRMCDRHSFQRTPTGISAENNFEVYKYRTGNQIARPD